MIRMGCFVCGIVWMTIRLSLCSEDFYHSLPMIVNFTDEVTKESGRAVYLDCAASSVDPEDPTNLVQWFRLPKDEKSEDEPLLMSSGTQLKHQDDRRFGLTVSSFKTESSDVNSMYTLQIDPAEEGDSATYQCKLTTPSTSETKNLKLIVSN